MFKVAVTRDDKISLDLIYKLFFSFQHGAFPPRYFLVRVETWPGKCAQFLRRRRIVPEIQSLIVLKTNLESTPLPLSKVDKTSFLSDHTSDLEVTTSPPMSKVNLKTSPYSRLILQKTRFEIGGWFFHPRLFYEIHLNITTSKINPGDSSTFIWTKRDMLSPFSVSKVNSWCTTSPGHDEDRSRRYNRFLTLILKMHYNFIQYYIV